MQKLVTIHLRESNKAKVEEHLEDYLQDGWRIVSIAAAGSGSSPGLGCAWVVVVLEKGQTFDGNG
jgi:nitrogenase subunit NifH